MSVWVEGGDERVGRCLRHFLNLGGRSGKWAFKRTVKAAVGWEVWIGVWW